MELDKIICGDCLEVLKTLPEDSVDAIVTDPPAGIAFMGKEWDKDKGGRNAWIAWMSQVAGECLRVIKPGGHALVWALPRTSHWTGMAWEEAGWEPRDKIAHVFGSGFPKSLDISKALDKMAGAEREITGTKTTAYDNSIRNAALKDNHNGLKIGNAGCKFNGFGAPITAPATPAAKQWAGWGSALKPAHEDWWLFRKPLDEKTIAENVLRWGTGGLNIDGCRISTKESTIRPNGIGMFHADIKESTGGSIAGRFPANLIHDGSPEVLAEFAKAGESRSSTRKVSQTELNNNGYRESSVYGKYNENRTERGHIDQGSAARFFQACPFTEEDIPAFLYYAKASRSERERGLDGLPLKECDNWPQSLDGNDSRGATPRSNNHPTVKPLSLMRYLCRLITPPGGVVLDPFAGSGTTCMAAKAEGFHYLGIEREAEYAEIARRRIAAIPTSLSRWVEDARP